MKNADMPAMPNPNPETYPTPVCAEWAYGLTKREMMAMNAPNMPDWFVSIWTSANSHNDSFFSNVVEGGVSGRALRLLGARQCLLSGEAITLTNY